MKEVTHEYGIDLFWKENLAKQLGGYVDGNYLRIPDDVHSGTQYALTVDPFRTVLVIDVTYNQPVTFHQHNAKDNFIGVYFNLTEGNAFYVLDEVSKPVGRWNHNLAIMDSSLDADYIIQEGSRTYMISIFIAKTAFKNYLGKLPQFKGILDSTFDREKNTFIRFERMSNEAWWLIDELRRIDMADPLYDVFLRGTVYALIADYMDQLAVQEVLNEKVIKEDMMVIIASQSALLEQITGPFPGIAALAAEACMSETRYKTLFKKLTGLSPNAFFLNNKLSLAKQELEDGAQSIREVAAQYSFASASHFSKLFKNAYGVAPKKHISYL
jgi:AraC-like DNA-binding protein